MKRFDLIKTILFTIIGILILIFNNVLIDYANYLIASVMIVYSLTDIIHKISSHEIKIEFSKFLNDFLIIILAVILVFLASPEEFVQLCIIWATWAILREEWEISEVLHRYRIKVLGIINILESLFAITISIIFIFSPTVEHLHTHIIILGIELILEVGFPILEKLFEKKLHKEKEIQS